MFKNQILFFFSDWLGNKTYGLLSSDKLSYFNETSGEKLVRKRNGADEVSFYEDEFSFVSQFSEGRVLFR